MAARSSKTRTLTDHDEIREWAEERGAQPACVRGTGGDSDTGMIRLDFPGYSGSESLQPIEWGEWFEKFDESRLALLVQDETAQGQQSNFNKLIGRETAQARKQGVRRASRRRLKAGTGRTAARRQSAKKTSGRKTAAKKSTRGGSVRGRTQSARGNTRNVRTSRKAGSTAARKRTKSTRSGRAQSSRGRGSSSQRRAA